jgi:hypothetical protein
VSDLRYAAHSLGPRLSGPRFEAAGAFPLLDQSAAIRRFRDSRRRPARLSLRMAAGRGHHAVALIGDCTLDVRQADVEVGEPRITAIAVTGDVRVVGPPGGFLVDPLGRHVDAGRERAAVPRSWSARHVVRRCARAPGGRRRGRDHGPSPRAPIRSDRATGRSRRTTAPKPRRTVTVRISYARSGSRWNSIAVHAGRKPRRA